jgi:hypothetical protein
MSEIDLRRQQVAWLIVCLSKHIPQSELTDDEKRLIEELKLPPRRGRPPRRNRCASYSRAHT